MEKGGNKLLVILRTGGEDDGQSATLALSCAISALSLGCDTFLFLTGKGAQWSYKEAIEKVGVSGFPSLNQLLKDFKEGGGHIIACTTCLDNCPIPTKNEVSLLVDGIEKGGFTTAVAIALEGRSITF